MKKISPPVLGLAPKNSTAQPSYPSSSLWKRPSKLRKIASAAGMSIALCSCSGGQPSEIANPQDQSSVQAPVVYRQCSEATPPNVSEVESSEVTIAFHHDIPSILFISRAVFSVDGHRICVLDVDDQRGPALDEEVLLVYQGQLATGRHDLFLHLEYSVEAFGIYGGAHGSRFSIRSSHSFDVEQGRTNRLVAIFNDEGPITEPIEERLNVRYQED